MSKRSTFFVWKNLTVRHIHMMAHGGMDGIRQVMYELSRDGFLPEPNNPLNQQYYQRFIKLFEREYRGWLRVCRYSVN